MCHRVTALASMSGCKPETMQQKELPQNPRMFGKRPIVLKEALSGLRGPNSSAMLPSSSSREGLPSDPSLTQYPSLRSAAL